MLLHCEENNGKSSTMVKQGFFVRFHIICCTVRNIFTFNQWKSNLAQLKSENKKEITNIYTFF